MTDTAKTIYLPIPVILLVMLSQCLILPETKRLRTMTTRTTTRGMSIHIRAHAADRVLIDRAAKATGKTRSEFMLDTARREAEEILRDRSVSLLDATAWKSFMAELESAPRHNPKLATLLARQAPWDK